MLKKTQFFDLNNYRKIAVLGRGGHGLIIQIEEKETHKIFAAKIPNDVNKKNISQEISILQMNHPSINKFVGFCPFDFENERRPVIITEFYSNRSLKQIFELNRNSKSRQILSNTKKLINIYGIAAAMSFLHFNNIFHNDLKPSNILEDDHLYPQISDFGLSQNSEEKQIIDNEKCQTPSGTPFYTPPEVLIGNERTPKSDVYSFSLIVYEILTNEVPFQDLKTYDFLTKVVQEGYRPDINKKSIPKCFQNLISKCWSQDPNERPTFNEIVSLLKENLEFANELKVDNNEYFNYIEYIDSFNGENRSVIKSNVKKVSLFQYVQSHPFLITDRIINLKKFEKHDRIGEGSRGVVYEIIYTENRKKYAAKILKKEFFKDFENENDSINLKREVSILQKLCHPAILNFIGYSPVNFDNSFNPVIVTELISNRSLEEIIGLERNGLAREFWDETKKLINIYGIASSMSYLHSLNILHRNLKPSNILIDELFHPILADFGFSKEISSNNENDDLIRNDETPLLGTYVYIAPEVFSKLEYSKASDVYSFALIVYEIITNQKPFLGSTVYQIMTNAVNSFRPGLNFPIPNCYRKLIEACWSPDPKNRPSFYEILNYLKTEKTFLSESVNQKEFFDYVEKIDNYQTTFNSSKTSLKVDFDSIYNRNKQFSSTEGFLDLANYEVKDTINIKGEFSTTFNVTDKKVGSFYTAKESNIEINNLTQRETEYLTEDLNLLPYLNHPSIIKFVGYSSIDFKNLRKPVYITELAPNKSLESFIDIERNGLSIEGWNDTKKLINIYGIASCMSYLHSVNILHHNLKPKNVFIDSFYHPKLTNFGYFVQNQIKKCMTVQSTFGTTDDPAYYAPEIFISGQFTKASDVYSFGFLVFEIITSEKPFQNISDSFEIIKEVVNNLGRPKINFSIPSCYKELIELCWKQNPNERPTFDQIVNALKSDPRFVTSDTINKQEYYQFIEFISHKTKPPNKNYEIDLFMKAAEKNDPVALFNLGLIHSKGRGKVSINKEKAAQFYERAASLGYIQAQYNLGLMYLKGDGITKDKTKAAKLFEMAASKGDAKAQFNLGIMYCRGEGVEQNYKKAIELYEKAAAQGDPEAQVNLGLLYDKGEGVPVNKKKAFDLYSKSAKKGNPIAQFNLGIMYHKGIDGILQKDNKKAVQLYQSAADQGIVQAQYNLGVLYLNGDIDVPINKDKAIELFEKAANQGYADAQLNLGLLYARENNEKMVEMFQKAASQNNPKALYNLGVLYAKGEIVEKNPKMAVKLYTKASELNFKQATFNLGVLYFNGADGVPQDKKKAAELFEKISDSNSKALFNLGIMYMNGDGVQKDEKKAIHFYERAASFNNSDALLNLGCIYDEGNCGIKEDKRKAFQYYKKAADLGNAKAQSNLGLMYQKGIGCEVDKNKAKEYFKLASDQGNDQAQLNLALLLLENEKSDKNQALNFLKSSANLGNPSAMFYLAKKYQQNNDIENAVDYFLRASKLGYYQAHLELGKIYLNGENGIEKDLQKAEMYLQEAASHDINEALIYLSEIHNQKSPNEFDKSPMKIIFDSSESRIKKIHKISNEPYTNFNSALTDISNIFINKNLSEYISINTQIKETLQNFNKEASQLMNKSSLPSLKTNQTMNEKETQKEKEEIKKLQVQVKGLETRLNQVNKQIELESYSPRRSSKRSPPVHSPSFESRTSISSIESISNLNSSQIQNLAQKAEEGDAKAQVALGAYFSTGKRVEKNYETALQFYLMAADQGNMNAQYAAGCFYYEGKGTPANKDEAFNYFKMAADQGHVKAQFAMGHFYQYDKEKSPSNLKKAVEWYEKAANQGHEGAIQILKKEKKSLLCFQ